MITLTEVGNAYGCRWALWRGEGMFSDSNDVGNEIERILVLVGWN
jgi:hypothetical protein